MPITATPPEQLEKVQELLRTEVRPPNVEARNVAMAAGIHEESHLEYRGRVYIVPPVPWQEGLQLQEIYLEIQRWAELEETVESLQQMLLCFERAIALFRELVKPASWVRRLFWRWSKNPFNEVSQQEVGELLGFFSSCRMKSRVRLLGSSAYRPSLSTLIASTSSPSTRPRTVISSGG